MLRLPRASCTTSLDGSEVLSAAAQLGFSRGGEREGRTTRGRGGGGGGGLWVGDSRLSRCRLGRLSADPWGGVGEKKKQPARQASRAVRFHMGRAGFQLETNQPAHTAHLYLSLCSLLLPPPPPPESLFCWFHHHRRGQAGSSSGLRRRRPPLPRPLLLVLQEIHPHLHRCLPSFLYSAIHSLFADSFASRV